MENNPPFESISYQTGKKHFRGLTKAIVNADGAVLVEKILGEERTEFSGKLSDAEMKAFLDMFQEANPCDFQKERKFAKPDEDKVQFVVMANGSKCSAEFWINDQWSNEGKKKWIALFNATIETISDGQVKF